MLLLIHILGAVAFIISGIGVLINKSSKGLMRGLVIFEFATGTILAMSSGSTLQSYCAKMGIYLAFWMATEIVSTRKIFSLEKPLTYKLKSKADNN